MNIDSLEFEHQPTVGVFITKRVIRNLKRMNYNFTSYLRILELAKAAKRSKVNLYFFSYKNVDVNKKIIHGTYLDLQKRKWSQNYFPFPDVLYDRIGSRNESVLAIREILEEHGVNKVNSKYYFNKWEVYEELSQVNLIKPYLPVTQLYEGKKEELETFIHSYPVVYLKGVKSGRGRGVIQVKFLNNGNYRYSHCRNEIEANEVHSFEELYDNIMEFFGEKEFILQEGIDLLTLNGNNIDFRAEVQRNGDGKLVILGICARIAKENSPITIHSTAIKINDFFMEFYDYSEEATFELLNKVNHFIKEIYHSLENVYGSFGEIGIDFGIDKKGEMWFIEPNSKTAKVSLMKAYDSNTYTQAFLNPINYAKYLVFKMD